MEPWIEEELNLYEFVGFWKRVLINIIDSLILILPTYLLTRISVPAAESAGSAFPLFIQFVLLMAFNIFMVVRYGGTPGRLLLGARIVDENGRYPVLRQALIRDSFIIVNSFLAVVVSLNTEALSSIPSSLVNWSPLAADLNAFVGWVVVLDCLFIVFTPRKRALHDLMARTYVVNKTALDRDQTGRFIT
ncbi:MULTISPECIES: RDD family protein [unclassified Paenibacillus]|uniref:RDD family protein n=1 Tax=unclassified Paenibacillus TaxID=185978 RepID=UPI0030F5A4A0